MSAVAGSPCGTQDRATGFVKFGGRWYNPTTGTWTQQDTLDAPLDPANANRYAFAGDDPINNTDATGQDCTLDWVLAGAAVVGLGFAVFAGAGAPGAIALGVALFATGGSDLALIEDGCA